MYQALYRKWRPRTFDQVVGQDHITETLKRQVAGGRFSHAYLFTGTRGTGKTTCAKILARAVNCEAPVDGNPCNRCPACRGIESGAFLDVQELDAASNNSVDQIRALRDEAVYAPAEVRKRVYIVDEVHMLSTSAFNALLKIMEEPPEHVMIILATTELQKVPLTVRSRCQQFAFKRISPAAIADQLKEVARAEGIDLADPAAELLARLADGGLRDGLSLMDQCSGGGGPVTMDTVTEILGLAGNRRTEELLGCVAREDAASALVCLDGLYRDGKDMAALLSEMAALIRDLLIRRTAPEGGRGLLAAGYEDKTLRELADAFTTAELLQMLGTVQRTQAELYRSASRRLDAELCVLRLCDRRLSDSTEGILARLSRLEERLDRGDVPAPAIQAEEKGLPPKGESPAGPEDGERPPWEEPHPTPDHPEKRAGFPASEERGQPASPAFRSEEGRSAAPPPEPSRTAPVPDGGGRNETWQGFLASLRDVPPLLRAFLFNTASVTGTVGEKDLNVWVDSEPTRGMLSGPGHKAFLEQAARAYTGRPLRVLYRLGRPEERTPPEAARPQTEPEDDNFDALLALGRQYGNIKVE